MAAPSHDFALPSDHVAAVIRRRAHECRPNNIDMFKDEYTDSKCNFLEKSKIYRLILRIVFVKMTHVLPLISAQNCDKNALQNRRGRPVLNKIGSLTIVFSVFSFAKICQCTQFLCEKCLMLYRMPHACIFMSALLQVAM